MTSKSLEKENIPGTKGKERKDEEDVIHEPNPQHKRKDHSEISSQDLVENAEEKDINS